MPEAPSLSISQPEIPKGAKVVRAEPHAGQWTVLQALRDPNIREVYVRKGRRFGGTWTAALAATEFASQNPTSPVLKGKPTEIAFIGPVYENAKKVWREIVDSFSSALLPHPHGYRESDLALVWRGGARGKCYSGENIGAILGSGFDIVELDEASNFPQGLVRSHIIPTLGDRNGRLWVISSPRHGRLNWFSQRALKAESGVIPGVVGFHYASKDNPRLSRQWLQDQHDDPDMDEQTWNEEFEALVLDSSSSWLDPSLIQYVPSKLIPGNTFNALLSDFAWGKPEPGMVDQTSRRRKDANVLAVLSQDLLGNVYLRRDGLYEKYLEPDEAFAKSDQLIRDYDIRAFCVEREVNVGRQVDDMFGRLWRAYTQKHRVPSVSMVRPQRGASWKTPAIRKWSVLLSRGKFFVEEGSVLDAPLRDEMMSYSETAATNDRCHDDALVAISDVMNPSIWQGTREGLLSQEAATGPDYYHLREAWAWARGEEPSNALQPRRSKYCGV